MSKINFIDYLVYLKKLFPKASIPKFTDKEIINVWYEGFQDISFEDAKKIANNYFKEEKLNFNYARLLEKKRKKVYLRGWD